VLQLFEKASFPEQMKNSHSADRSSHEQISWNSGLQGTHIQIL